MLKKTIFIFEPDSSGHHAGYLFHLLKYFLDGVFDFRLVVLVGADFFEKHSSIVQQTQSENIIWLKMPDDVFKAWENKKSNVIERAKFEWAICSKYALEYRAIHVFFMYFDHLQLACLTEPKMPCAVSGILFRPTLVNYPANTFKEKLSYWRKYFTLKLVLKSKKIDSLLCLDSFAVNYMTQYWETLKVKYLPDPVQVYPSTQAKEVIKTTFGIKNNKIILLIFGYLDDRKGISVVMDTLAKLPKELAKKVCLLIVGPWEISEKKRFEEKKSVLQAENTFEVKIHNDFVADENIQAYFEVADYVLALYQKHIGMSAIMVRAASALKPLITYNYGLMGKITQEKQLGIAVDESKEDDLLNTLKILFSKEAKTVGNQQKMKEFADINQATNYAKVILTEFERISLQA